MHRSRLIVLVACALVHIALFGLMSVLERETLPYFFTLDAFNYLTAPTWWFWKWLFSGVGSGPIQVVLMVVALTGNILVVSLIVLVWFNLFRSTSPRLRQFAYFLPIGLLLPWLLDGFAVLEMAVQKSEIAKWWSCRGVHRPFLAKTTEKWEIEYSWGGGLGPGTVILSLNSKGSGSVRFRAQEAQDWSVRQVQISEAQMQKLAKVIDQSALLCTSQISQDHAINDIGDTRIVVATPAFSREVKVGTCMAISHPWRIGEVLEVIDEWEPLIGPEIKWGPYAYSATGIPCKKHES